MARRKHGEPVHGWVVIESGLDIELDEQVALGHPSEGDKPHLEMADRPID